MPQTPEQLARQDIDAKLAAAGWLVQRHADMNLAAGRGVAICEFPMKPGFGSADYLLYVDRKAVGAIEAKVDGALTGVEAQTGKYAAGLPDKLPAHRCPLPFLFEANAALTFFTNGLDPALAQLGIVADPVDQRFGPRKVEDPTAAGGRYRRLRKADCLETSGDICG